LGLHRLQGFLRGGFIAFIINQDMIAQFSHFNTYSPANTAGASSNQGTLHEITN
jgi:hypothetical protein